MRVLRVVSFVVLVLVCVVTMTANPLRAQARPATAPSAACAALNGRNCSNCSFGYTGLFNAGEIVTYTMNTNGPLQSMNILDNLVNVASRSTPGSLTYIIPTTANHFLYFDWQLVVGGAFFINLSVACTAPALANVPPPPVFFDPGDIRVDGWAGDRLAVYCPSDKQIQVIGIGANGKGAGVAVFNPAEVIAAGAAGLSVPLKSYVDPTVDLGRVTIQMVLNDGVTSIYIAWNGGILNATGQGDFKKLMITPMRFCPFTFR